jgi:hypothetical protein
MLDPKIIDELKSIVGERYVLTAPEDLVAYSYDATFTSARPNLVVRGASGDGHRPGSRLDPFRRGNSPAPDSHGSFAGY